MFLLFFRGKDFVGLTVIFQYVCSYRYIYVSWTYVIKNKQYCIVATFSEEKSDYPQSHVDILNVAETFQREQ